MKVTDHPNGFLKVTFSETEAGSDRLDVWDVPGYADSDIHQHRAGIRRSKILAGVMREDLYVPVPDEDGEYEFLPQTDCWTDSSGRYRVDEHAPRVRCRAELAEVLIHRAGETYERPEQDFHLVIALETPLVTRCEFGPVTQRRHGIIRRIGRVP